jgi:tetratricopeptide (TPR) repeat protein
MQLRVLFAGGRVVAGWRLLEAIGPELRKLADNPLTRDWILLTQGLTAAHVGKHDLADAWLREDLALQSEMGKEKYPGTALQYWAIAENLTMWGRTKDAEAVLDEAPKFGGIRGNNASEQSMLNLLALARARARLVEGRTTDAIEILQGSAPTAADPPNDWTEYRATLGEALCAAGRNLEGVGLLKQAVATDEPVLFKHAMWLGRRRALIGLCAAGMGDRRMALRYAAQAREDFVAQSDVSPYFKAPLFKLERALGMKLPPI